MTDDLKHSQLRAIQYFYADGSFEFGFGLLCLLLGVYFFVETHVQGWLLAVVDGSLVLVMIGGAWLINRLIKRLKERLTWPRTGYIKYRREEGPRRGWRVATGLVVGGLVGAIGAVLVTSLNIRLATMPVLTGFILGIVLGFLGWRARLPRFYLLAGLSAATGLAVSGMENAIALAACYLAIGLLLFVSGGVTLWVYLRSTRPPESTLSENQEES